MARGKPDRLFADGPATRVRRGKVVEIPEEWRGHVTHRQTIRKRLTVSRRTRKSKKERG